MKPSDKAEEKKRRIRDEIMCLGQRVDELERILPNFGSEEKQKAKKRITLYRLQADRLSDRIREESD